MPYRGQAPVMLALIGDSGSGKSTLSAGIVETLGTERVSDICLDDYHKYDRVQRSERGITALHPECNHIGLMRQHLQLLRRGETIFKPVYDHTTGTFGTPEYLTPGQFVIVHGLLGLHDDALKSSFHVSIFLDPDPELRVQWKIQRDTSKRGYNVEQVRQALQHRQEDAERYIMPQRARADMVIRFYPQPGYWATRDNSALDVRILLRRPLGVQHIVSQVDWAEAHKGSIRPPLIIEQLDAAEGGGMVLDIDGNIPEDLAIELEERFWSQMERVKHLRPEAIGVFQQNGDTRRSKTLALTQVLVTFYCIQAAEQERQRLAASADVELEAGAAV
jgi:phosphoribulokinase